MSLAKYQMRLKIVTYYRVFSRTCSSESIKKILIDSDENLKKKRQKQQNNKNLHTKSQHTIIDIPLQKQIKIVNWWEHRNYRVARLTLANLIRSH